MNSEWTKNSSNLVDIPRIRPWINDSRTFISERLFIYPSDSELLKRKKINQQNERQYKLSMEGLKVLREVLGNG